MAVAENPLRVLHLIKALGRGGAEVLLAEGLAVADRDRFDFSYGYLQPYPADMAEDLRGQGVPVECFELRSNLRILLGANRIARYIRQNDIDLVHAHLPMAGVAARIAGRLAGVPVVYTEHSLVERYHPLTARLNKYTWRLQEQVIAISQDVAESIHRNLGGSVPMRTVWNGVNTDKFSPEMVDRRLVRSRLGIPEDAPVVGTVVSLRDGPAKRLDIWLDAARRIYEKKCDTCFIIVGDGASRPGLEAKVSSFGMSEVVHFVGKQTDVRPYLAALDVFLMSSAYEGFGIALVEAMAMENAVVATNVEGVRNIVTSGETGLLATFDENVTDALAGLVMSLLHDPVRRRELAVAGRRAAVEKFSIKRMQGELESIYEKALARFRHTTK